MSVTTEPANLTNAAIADYAQRIGEHHAIYSGGRADLERLIGELGGQWDYGDGPESTIVYEPGKFTIFLPHFTSRSRDRFTMAHELGHYFLHYLYSQSTGAKIFNRGSRNRAETEANVFASALLMPADDFKRVWQRLESDEWEVANHFGVSPAAANVRAQVLGLQ
ncbi:ImmA/IrrE family metallo-endopeptidase [Ornithinimicrobium cerasi]|uniref:ImmA/IrrE family metallo-endopeptidase n=1 Tax=Ornithinimicrobium cerasi TaxID=2248773 RepID=UPI000EFFE84F|nr:ImmA/IrrE family metallo-endopeptidase [Ornithinimicrobium cerasi]